jgi:hypothetical protein
MEAALPRKSSAILAGIELRDIFAADFCTD